MFDPHWRKIWRDTWLNKTRSLLVVLSIAVGSFAVGTVAHMWVVVGQDLKQSYQEINPAQVIIYTEEGFDEDFITFIRKLPQVAAVSARRSTLMKFQPAPDEAWYPIEVIATSDYEQLEVNRILPEKLFVPDPPAWPEPEVWPPPDKAFLLERTSLVLATLGFGREAQQGMSILVETAAGKQRIVPLPGLVYDLSQTSAPFSGMACAFITFDTLSWFGLSTSFNELHIIVDTQESDWQTLKTAARNIQDRVERAGYTVVKVEVPEPGKLPQDNLYQAITLILGAMGAFSLFLAIFLIINTISALLIQQMQQIGVMKAVGARPFHLISMYLGMVTLLGVLSLAIAIPLSIFVAGNAINVMAYFINYNMSQFRVEPSVIILQVAVAIGVPLLAALYPIIAGTRITIREAISSYGLSSDNFTRKSWLNKLLEQLKGVPRPILLSLHNTFRRRLRLGLTLLTLTLAGAAVMAVISVRASMDATLDEAVEYWQFDVQVQLERPYRIPALTHQIQQLSGITTIESWGGEAAYRIRPDESSSESFFVTALPADTSMLNPNLLDGRWLQPGDTNQLVINNYLHSLEPDIEMGDTIQLKLDGRERLWQVIGVVKTVGNIPQAYANYDHFAILTRDIDMASSIQVTLLEDDAAAQDEMAQQIEKQLTDAGYRVSGSFTNHEQRSQSETFFDIVAMQLLIMAALMVLVGGLGLTGTMSLNVIERTREIGVMRAVGASDTAVLQIFITEGILIGLLSWFFGLALAIPLGAVLSETVGIRFLNAPLNYTFSLPGALIWLLMMIMLSIGATYLPAQQAAQMTIREVLAYE